MRRQVLALAAGVLLVAILALSGCSSTETTTPTTPKTTPTTTPRSTTPSTTPSSGTGSTVSIVDFSFQPATLTVPEHTTVTWTNNGAVVHDVVFNTFKSPALQPGMTFTHTFDSSGAFTYNCSFHPQMVGTIMVTSSSGSEGSTSPSGSESPDNTPSPTPQTPGY